MDAGTRVVLQGSWLCYIDVDHLMAKYIVLQQQQESVGEKQQQVVWWPQAEVPKRIHQEPEQHDDRWGLGGSTTTTRPGPGCARDPGPRSFMDDNLPT